MKTSEFPLFFNKQKEFFFEGSTTSYHARRVSLERLKKLILKYEKEIHQALFDDLGKCELEAAIAETGFVISEIDHALKKLKKWMKPQRVRTPLVHFPSCSYIVPEPLGVTLIISPWNYPFQLLISPLIGALAAGNTAILKPSEVSQNTSKVIAKMIGEGFDSSHVLVVEGGVPETQSLLELPFDHIFYTGNGHVARIVMEKAAKNLTPVTLELGGKSPCFVYGNVDLNVAARRLVWGKFFNAGQTCVAPDYVLISPPLKHKFLEKIKEVLRDFYGENPLNSPDYGKIINRNHFERIRSLITPENVIYGGEFSEEKNKISPTVMEITEDHKIMEDEIFGPILPIIEKATFDLALDYVQRHKHPLAAYLFTNDRALQKKFESKIQSGGMCFNDTVIQLSSDTLPFGGVGASGMGRYHGKFSFDTFSHQKSVMKRFFILDLPVRYPPYKGKLKIVKWLLKLLG